MKQFLTGMLAALLAVAIYSCTTTGGASGGAGNAVLFKLNGRGITADEFFASGPARGALSQFLMLESMKSEAKKAGAVVDEKELQQQIDDFKKNVTMGGTSWEDFLKDGQMTEKEFIDQQRDMMLFDALKRKSVKVSEEDIKKVWEDDKQSLIDQYAAENKLPDSEKAKITFEQVKDLARKRVEDNKAQMYQGEVMGDIMLNAKIDFVSIKDPAKKKRIEEQVLAPLKEQGEMSRKQSRDARKAAGEDVPEDEPAAEGDNAAAEGEEVPHDHDGDGVSDHGDEAHAEGEEVPHDHDGDGVSDHGDEAHEEGGEAAPEGEGEGGGE
jgi:hypothetical protein